MAEMNVYWYKYHADHGPGHQSHTTEYKAYHHVEPMSDDDEYWSLVSWSQQFNNVHSTIVRLEILPDAFIEEKIKQLQRKKISCDLEIVSLKTMLD